MLVQLLQLLFRILRPIVHIDEPHSDIPAPAVAVYVAGEDGEDVFIQDGGGHSGFLISAKPAYVHFDNG